MATSNDFVSDLNELPDDVVSANTGNVETQRGSDDVGQQRPETPTPADTSETPDPDAPAKPLSLRDQISSALKGEETPPAAQIDGGPVRNPDGTFAPKPAADPNAASAPAVPVVQLPQGLGLDAATFAALPAETQQTVARTMETLNQQAAQFAAYGQIEQVIAPRRQAWALNGMSEGQVINQLFALSDFAEKDPNGFVRYFAEQRGLDLEDLAFGPAPVDPTIAAAQQRIQALEAQVSGFATQQQQTAHTNIVNEVVAFAEEKATDGSLLRPHFAELGNDVLPFIQAAMQQNPNRPRTDILADAYDRACWANPSVRTKMQTALDATREAERIRASKDAATRARKAGVSIAGGTPSDTGPANAASAGSGSLRDSIKAAVAAST